MVGIIVANGSSLLSLMTQSFNHVGVFLCLLFIYWVAAISHRDQIQFRWTGFTRLPLILAWIIFTLPHAAVILVGGTVIAYLYTRTTQNNPPEWRANLHLVGNSGGSILGIHLIYTVLGGVFPQITSSAGYPDISLLILSIIVGSLLSIVLIMVTQGIKLDVILSEADKYLVPEVLIILISLLLPIFFVQVNMLVFIVSTILIAVQVFRSAKVLKSEVDLKKRLQEMSILNNLSATITSQLSLDIAMETVYKELSTLINATTIYIALYDEDQQTVDFRLVRVDGIAQNWQKQILKDDLLAYVVHEQRSICLSKQEANGLFKNLFDGNTLTEAQYMIAPLSVSSKVFGVLSASHDNNPEAFSDYDFTLFKTVTNQASLAIRNAMLYDRTVRLADNLSIINQSLQDVMFNLDRGTSLKTACQIAVNVTRASKAAIFLLEPALDNQLKRVESVGFEAVSYRENLNYQPNLFSKGARIINDVSMSDEGDIVEQARNGDFRACVQIPLKSGNTLIGTLEVYHDNPYYYEPTEINLLKMLGNQVTAALDNADLLQALELYAAEQAQLVHLSRIAGGTLDLDTIIYDVCEILSQIMNVSRVEIGLWHAERNNLRLYAPDDITSGLSRKDIDINTIPEMANLLDESNLSTLAVYRKDSEVSQGFKSYIEKNHDVTLGMTQMRLEQDVLGIIILGDLGHREFNDNDFRLLEMANYQITVQIHNARVHTRTQQQLVLGLEQLGLIEDITQQISQALDLDIIIQNVLEAALQSTQADFVSISLPSDNNPNIFDTIYREVIDGELIPRRILFELKAGVVGHVMKTAKAVVVPDNNAFEGYVIPEGSANRYQSSLAVPLIARDDVIGVLNLESTLPNFFSQEQADFINSLAGHTAISITNANLLRERENQINVLTWLRALSLDALSSLKAEEVYDSILRTSLILLDASETVLYHYDYVSHDLQLLQSMEVTDDAMQPYTPFIPKTLILDAINKQSIEFIQDIQDSSAFLSFEQSDDISYKSLIIIPIIRRNTVYEVLCVGFKKPYSFSEDNSNTLDLLSAQVAGHLENVALNTQITNSNNRMRAILDSTTDGIILLDNEGHVQDANSSASDITNTNLQAYLFKPFGDIQQSNGLNEQTSTAWNQIVEAYLKSPNSIHNQTYTFEHINSLVHVKMSVTEVQDRNNVIVGRLLVLRDITEEKTLQDFRETMQSMVLHDLRGPLTAIVTSMYVAENILTLYDGTEFDELEDALKKTFSVSLKSAEDMLRQVDTLRDLPMMNQMTVEPQLISAYEIAENAYSSLSANFMESNIQMKIDIEKDSQVFVDESLIQRVIVNLLHNAYKFTPLGGKVLIQMTQCAKDEDYFCVQIADNGPGIPEAQRERIFEQFIQIEGQKPRAGGKGTGLGLNFCKLAIEGHGGRIWVEEDSPLSGACFAFTIPKTDWRNSH